MNEFRTVVQWIPDHLLRVYGRPEVVLHWYDVGAEIGPPSDPANPPKLDRPRFSATASRLDLALETMLSQLEAGTVEVAALVTDLVGTGESTGAVAVSKHLRGWLKSVDVRTGRHHLALVGVKGRYVGATHPTCPVRNGLACRFSERRGGYLRLERAASVPFYVLIVGADDRKGQRGRSDALRRRDRTRIRGHGGIVDTWRTLTRHDDDLPSVSSQWEPT